MSLRSRLAWSLLATLVLALSACGKKHPAPEPTKAPETKPAEVDAASQKTEPDAAAQADAQASGPAPIWSTAGFATPESVLVVPAGDAYLVSNIDGAPLDKDDNGFISKLGNDGRIIELKWIDASKPEVELNAPKGMGIMGGTLYVADIDVVRKFDATTGAALGFIAIPNAVFLNDVAVAKGGNTVYVSDSALGPDFKPKGTPAVWAIDAEGTAKALDLGATGQPNGIAVEVTGDGDFVYYNGFDDAKVVHRFDPKTKGATTIPVPAGQLDGLDLVKDGDATWLLVSSWETGSVYKIDKDGKATVIAAGLKGPADFGFDVAKRVVVLPVFMENRVASFAL